MGFSFASIAIVAAVALLAPLAVGIAGVRVPAIVVEILLGVMIGPQVLALARVDAPVRVMSLIGLSFLLLLAGLEIDLMRLRGRVLRVTALAYAVSFVIAIAVGFAMSAAGIVRSPLLVAIMLSATGLGVILPILKDAGQTTTAYGQVIVAGASIAEVAPIIGLSLFFSGQSSSVGVKLVLLSSFGLLVVAVVVVIFALERSRRLSRTLLRLQDTTAQIRVRAAFLLLAVFAALAARLGLEAILGAFLAGAIIGLVDRDQAMTHPRFRIKLEAVGFGVFIPFFFIATGMQLDVRALFGSASAIAHVPLFLGALLVIRGLPALLYRPFANARRLLVAAGLLQATSLGLLVVAGQIGVALHLIRPTNYAALVAAGLLSVLIFPLVALSLLRRPDAVSDTAAMAGDGRAGTAAAVVARRRSW